MARGRLVDPQVMCKIAQQTHRREFGGPNRKATDCECKVDHPGDHRTARASYTGVPRLGLRPPRVTLHRD